MDISTVICGCVMAAGCANACYADQPAPEYSSTVHASYLNQGSSDITYTPGVNLSASTVGSSVSVISKPSVPSFEVIGSSSAVPPDPIDPSQNPYRADSSLGTAYATYFYGVLGAIGTVPVDISYEIEAKTTASGPYVVGTKAQASITNHVANTDSVDYTNMVESDWMNDATNADQKIEATFTTSVTGALSNYIDMDAFAETEGGVGSSSTADAFVDPHIYIDPAYLATHPGLTLQVSPGFGNSDLSAVPDPSVWALMFAGIGTIGAALRLSRRDAMQVAT